MGTPIILAFFFIRQEMRWTPHPESLLVHRYSYIPTFWRQESRLYSETSRDKQKEAAWGSLDPVRFAVSEVVSL
jgi:hypothetical protein